MSDNSSAGYLRQSYFKRRRCHALGINNDGRLLHITFTLRSVNALIRVISARDMHRKERAIYEKNESDT
ncbi:MAG: hypothetical protein DRQ64_01095 [Gammaproteobacteria bacterium]|nr:MAG: hypothetical protein DRQ64_01095 [Gammaproteobacteria bacterium]